VTLNGEDLSYMLDETTPVKACADLAYHVNHDGMVLVSLQLFFLKKFAFRYLLVVSYLFNLKEWMSDNMNKEPEERRETCFQFKRRRLQFDTHLADSPFCDEDLTSVFLKSNVSVAYLSIMTKACSYFNLVVVHLEINGPLLLHKM